MIKDKNFSLLIGSQLFSVLGTTIIGFVISLYVLDLTHSSLVFSVIASLSIIGRLICLPFCGILADRLPKKRLMLTMDFLYMLLALGLLAVSQMKEALVPIGIFTVLIGMVSAFETPVVQSTIPLICTQEEIPQANGIISSIGMLGNIVGPILAGIIYRFDAVYQIFAICGGFFLLAILCEILLKVPVLDKISTDQSIKAIIVGDLKEVTVYLRAERTIVKIGFIAFLLNLFISSFIQVMIPFISRIQMGVSDTAFGTMNTVFAIGSLVGTLLYSALAAKLSNKSLFKNLILMSLLFFSLVIPLGMMKTSTASFWVMVLIVTVILGVVTMISVQLIVYIQLIAKQALLGRIMSLVIILSTLASPIGQMMYGWIGDSLSKNTVMILIMALTLIAIVISWYARKTFAQMKEMTGAEVEAL